MLVSDPLQPDKMNKLMTLSVKLVTFIKTKSAFFKERIKLMHLLVLLILALLLSISHQLSEIKKQLKLVVLIQKLVHPEQDSQIALLSSEQQDFALLNPKEQIEQWKKMRPDEKPQYAAIFYDKISGIAPDDLGISPDEYDTLLDDAEAIANKNPLK
jgi:hypothetical protein